MALSRRWAGLISTARIVVILVAMVLAAAVTDSDLDDTTEDVIEVVLAAVIAWMIFDWGFTAWLAARRGGREAMRDYLGSGRGVVDAVSAFVVPLALLAGIDAPTAWPIGAVVWVAKLLAVTPRLARLQRVVARESGSLLAVAALGLGMLFFSAVTVHLLERADQPKEFGSVPESLWWAMNTVTGVGIEAVPETLLGRIIASSLMVAGLGVFSIWAGILASGFAQESRREEFLGSWELVAKVPFLKSLGPAAIADLAGSLRRWDVPENTVVVRRGQRGECMYFVAEGSVEVQLPNGPLELAEGSFFGEMALLEGGGGIRSATVRCPQPSTLLVLDVADFRALIARHPALATAVEEAAARRRGAPANAPAPPAEEPAQAD